jgi:hypothetical protein
VIFAKMHECPRCMLPQEGIYKCQYCGYDLTKYKKKHSKLTRKSLKDITGKLKKAQIFSSNKRSKDRSLNNAKRNLNIPDNGGTRSGNDRRQQHYITYFPERRSGSDRRKGFDRRNLIAKKRWS